jgi:hypothetical protein
MGAIARLATRSALTASMLTVSAWPAAVAATGEDEIVTLGGFTATVGVIDLDDDGMRDLVRFVGASELDALVVEAWSWDTDAWRVVARLPIDAAQTGSRPFVDGSASPVTPIVWNDGRRDRLLVATGETNPEAGGVESLTVHELALRDRRLVLSPLLEDGAPADRIEAADLDADGVEELVITESGGHLGRDRAVWLLRWTGAGFAGERIAVGDGREISEPILGETDGRPGVDVHFAGQIGELYRLDPASPNGVERAQLSLDDPRPQVWPMAVAGGALFLYVDEPAAATVLRVDWPAGGTPVLATVASVDPTRSAIWPIHADGDDVFFAEQAVDARGYLAETVIRDRDLQPVARVAPSDAIERTAEWLEQVISQGAFGMQPFPYAGVLTGGVDGVPAMVLAGNLVMLRGDEIEVRPVGSFAGVAPLGLIGPDDGWMALSLPWWGPWDVGYLYSQPRIEDSVQIVRADAMLAEEADGGSLDVELRGAARVTEADGTWVASPDGGFEIVVRGLPGSSVTVIVGRQSEASAEIGPEGSVVLSLDPGPRREETVDYSAAVVMVTPTGHLYGTEWTGRVLREPPELDASAVTETGAFSSTVSGSVGGTVTITVDGTPVTIGADGTFETTVEAGIIPREAVVVATDPLGTETERRVQVVGFVDHRGWPWPAFAGVLIAAAGALMFVRAPRGRPPEAAIATGASIEEIELP